MSSPNPNDPRRPSLTASPRTGLLPSPFSHSDEALADVPQASSRFGGPDPPLYEEDEGADDYIDAPDGSLLPPRTFAPFFTMITDAESGETYHPTTYYVFADDEPDVLSSAALHALDSSSVQAQREADAKALIEGGVKEEERYILVAMGQEGTNVVGAKSLTPSWAVTNAEVRAAPTFDGGEGEGSDGLMLMIEGLTSGASAPAPSTRPAKERRAKAEAEASFDEARRKGGGNIITGMEELAQGMVGGIRTLDKVAALE